MDLNYSKEEIISRRGYRPDIEGDAFSLYISTYPSILDYLKNRIGNPRKTLLELCCGIGVTLEYLGHSFQKIIGVDIDPKILAFAQKNLEAVKLLNKSRLIQGDVNDEKLLKSLKADIVIYDIPFWYEHEKDLTKRNPDLKDLVRKIRENISGDIVIYTPPHYKFDYLKGMLGEIEYQEVYLNGKHDRNIVYLGNLIEKEGITNLSI